MPGTWSRRRTSSRSAPHRTRSWWRSIAGVRRPWTTSRRSSTRSDTRRSPSFSVRSPSPRWGSTARLLAKNFASLEDVKAATVERLVEIDGIGEEVAGRIRNWFDGERNLELIEALLESGVEIVVEEDAAGGGTAFDGAVVVFTGTLERMSRFEAKAAVEAQGGRVASSVSKKTTFLVVGGKPGSKAKKAEETA